MLVTHDRHGRRTRKQETDEANTPTRMVGSMLCSEKRKHGTDAVSVLMRAVSGSHGRVPLTIFLVVISIVSGRSAFGSANLAGRKLTPNPVPQSRYAKFDPPPSPGELEAARGMEAMFVQMVLEEMRKSVPENDVVPVGNGERIYRQMLDTEYAQKIAESGTVGISDLVLAELRRKR